MFTLKHRIVCGILLLMLCMCSPDSQSPTVSQTVVPSSKNAPKDFLDSVSLKMRLSFDQVKDRANIDSTYYKDNIKFIGDTVWYRNKKHSLAVVRFYGLHVNKKLLLVFNQRGKCTASLTVGMNGDVDNFDSVVLDYKITDNNSFSTTEIWTYRGGSESDKITITKQFYQINKKGSILAQNNIIRSFTRSKETAPANPSFAAKKGTKP